MPSRLVITFLPRSKHLLILWLQSPSVVIFGALKNKVWHCFHCFPIYFPWRDGTWCHDPWMFPNSALLSYLWKVLSSHIGMRVIAVGGSGKVVWASFYHPVQELLGLHQEGLWPEREAVWPLDMDWPLWVSVSPVVNLRVEGPDWSLSLVASLILAHHF